MKRWNFVVYLQGEGEDMDEAEEDAFEAFILDPGELTLVDIEEEVTKENKLE